MLCDPPPAWHCSSLKLISSCSAVWVEWLFHLTHTAQYSQPLGT